MLNDVTLEANDVTLEAFLLVRNNVKMPCMTVTANTVLEDLYNVIPK